MNTRDVERYVRGALLMDLAGCPPEYAASAVAYVIAYLQGSRQPAADCYLLSLALQAQAAFGRLPVINTDDDYTDSVMGALEEPKSPPSLPTLSQDCAMGLHSWFYNNGAGPGATCAHCGAEY